MSDAYEFFKDEYCTEEISKEEVLDTIDQLVEDARQAEIEAEVEADIETAIEAASEVEVKAIFPESIIKELRRFDRKGRNRTCAGCATRFPVKAMDDGKAEFCETCRK